MAGGEILPPLRGPRVRVSAGLVDMLIKTTMGEAMRYLAVLLVLGALTACGDVRFVGSLGNPYCAPDGSVVLGIYPNSQGKYDGIKSNRENCPWNR